MIDTLTLTQALIKRASITPDDQDCQALIADHLKTQGFTCTHLAFGEVKNLWAQLGEQGPLLVFAGHTDVVPPGPREAWTSDPFSPTIRGSNLYGRGAADMKSGLAAMVTAAMRFLQKCPKPNFRLGFLITSDEEGKAIDGTKRVVEYLQNHGIFIDYCIVGEASSDRILGDTIKNGRRGSLSAKLTIHGVQGHIAYPDKSDNPIHRGAPFLAELCQTHWDDGNEFFPPTSMQISNLHAGTGADNVIPGSLIVDFNFRYSSEVTADVLKEHVEALIAKHHLTTTLAWHHSGEPFLTKPGELTDIVCQAIENETAQKPQLSTTGGTSDGRFIAKMGGQVIEFGPCNASIHKIDEHINVDDLRTLSTIYEQVLSLLNARSR